MVLAMVTLRLCLITALTSLAAAGCGSGGGTATSDSTGATTGAGAGTGTGTSTGATTDLPPTTGTPTTGDSSTTQASPGSTSGDGTTGSSSGSTGAASTQASTGDGSTGTTSTGGTGSESTGGGVPVASFECTELTVVDLQLKEKISGSFDAEGVPLAVTATMVKGGAIDFQVAVAAPVAADDPYAADVAFWEQQLTAQGWDVNPPGEPGGDRRYIFIPEGAQFVAKFSLFYYRVYEGGGNGQFEFECLKQ